ncbi:MAG: hypothetical protein LQ346_006364, partial [Caloplaca aetnensis]
MFALAAATIPYDLQSNGVICSPYFGAPLLEDCQNAILEYETDRESDRDGLYASVIVDDDPKASLPLPLPWVFTNGTCVFAISIVRGGRNNVTGSLLSDIAQTVAPTCASLPASQGGWGAYADTAVIIASADSNFTYEAQSNATTPAPPSGTSSPSPSQSSGIRVAEEKAYYRGSFWADNAQAVCPT